MDLNMLSVSQHVQSLQSTCIWYISLSCLLSLDGKKPLSCVGTPNKKNLLA